MLQKGYLALPGSTAQMSFEIISTAEACCQNSRKHYTCNRDTILHLGHKKFQIQKNTTSPKPSQNVLGTAVDVPRVNVGGFEVSFLVALTGLRFLILSKTSLYN